MGCVLGWLPGQGERKSREGREVRLSSEKRYPRTGVYGFMRSVSRGGAGTVVLPTSSWRTAKLVSAR